MTELEIIPPLKPVAFYDQVVFRPGAWCNGWAYMGNIRDQAPHVQNDLHVWDHDYGFRVLSAVEVVEEKHDPETSGPHYHLSMTAWPNGVKDLHRLKRRGIHSGALLRQARRVGGRQPHTRWCRSKLLAAN